MIGTLRGTLLAREDAEVTIEVAGIGYRVKVAPTLSIALGEPGDEVFVFTHHHVKEDSQALYGFRTLDERRTFEALIAAPKVGPTLAQSILSVHEPTALRLVVADDDIAALCLVPGVGRKTAARLLIELKTRLDLPDGDAESLAGLAASSGSATTTAAPSPLNDVREALAGLGYGPDEIAAAVRDLPADGDSSALLKGALRRLAEAG
ncbi:MAG: Holliday junction branch migration protein RuvA [Actinomycetota bacterium]